MNTDGKPGNTKRKGTIIAGIVFLLLGIAISVYSLLNLQYMMAYSLGPGFLPIWYGVILSVLSVLVIIRALQGKYDNAKGAFPAREDRIVMLILLMIVVGTIIFMRFFGMVLSIAIYLLLAMKFVEGQSWRMSILTSLIGTVCIYLIFCVGFKINFPTGVLGF